MSTCNKEAQTHYFQIFIFPNLSIEIFAYGVKFLGSIDFEILV